MKVFGDELVKNSEITVNKNAFLRRMVLYERNTKLLITDTHNSYLHLFDLDGHLLMSILIKSIPSCICVHISNKNEIFIGDINKEKIFVYKSNFIDHRLFIKDILPEYIQIDNEFDSTRLYVSECKDKLSVWKINDGKKIGSIKIKSPWTINFSEHNIYVSSPAFKNKNPDSKIDPIKLKDSCIYEINKDKLEIKRRIIGDWCSPFLLNIESNSNIILLAFTFNEINGTLSEMRYFLIIDKNGHIIKKIELPYSQNMCDSILFRKKLFICNNENTSNKLRLYEL